MNEVSFLLLDVIDEMRLLQPSSNIQVSKRSPDAFIRRAAAIIRKGWGQPSVFNADLVVEELLRQGKSIEDARAGGTSGCVETGAFGKEAYILTGYVNLPKVLEITLNDGLDPATGRSVGLSLGDPASWTSFDELYDAFARQLRHVLDIKIRGNRLIERLYATHMPAPFLSLLVDDCIARGVDYNAGGARYNTTYMMPVGIGTLTDSLSAIEHHVFRSRRVALADLLRALAADFADNEPLRQLLWHRTPRYGNDDSAADTLLRRVFETAHAIVDGRPNTRGGEHHLNYLSTTCHVLRVAGRRDARRPSCGDPGLRGHLAGAGDRHARADGGAAVGLAPRPRTVRGHAAQPEARPEVLEGDEGLDRLTDLIRSYFALDGHHVQFNVVTADTLRAAQAHPEQHRDLIVRVAGYSDYFCDLTRPLQDEIIARTEHRGL